MGHCARHLTNCISCHSRNSPCDRHPHYTGLYCFSLTPPSHSSSSSLLTSSNGLLLLHPSFSQTLALPRYFISLSNHSQLFLCLDLSGSTTFLIAHRILHNIRPQMILEPLAVEPSASGNGLWSQAVLGLNSSLLGKSLNLSESLVKWGQ